MDKTIEQKAKAYDEAIERAKYYQKENSSAVISAIFPELKESEDEKIRKEIMSYIKSSGAITNKQWIAWLEKQGTSYTKKDIDDAYVEGMAFAKNELEKQKTAWSEEDEKMIRGLIVICDEWTTRHSFYPIENCEIEKLKNWLESLKDRYTWKPSGEQLYILHWLATNVLGDGVVDKKASEILYTLYDDLKKL